MGRRGIRGLKARVGRECCISRRGHVEQWWYTGRRSPTQKSQCYNEVEQWKSQCYKQGCSRGANPGVRAAKNSEIGEGEY